jgi:hypothetical protein
MNKHRLCGSACDVGVECHRRGVRPTNDKGAEDLS